MYLVNIETFSNTQIDFYILIAYEKVLVLCSMHAHRTYEIKRVAQRLDRALKLGNEACDEKVPKGKIFFTITFS